MALWGAPSLCNSITSPYTLNARVLCTERTSERTSETGRKDIVLHPSNDTSPASVHEHGQEERNMDPFTPNTILLLITIFNNGPMVIVPDSNLLTAAACEKRAVEANGGWKFYGDRDVFSTVHTICVEKK